MKVISRYSGKLLRYYSFHFFAYERDLRFQLCKKVQGNFLNR
jgi:hypothetical protein